MKGHTKEDCECFFCRNDQIRDYVKETTDLLNKESENDRTELLKRIIKVLMGTTQISLLDRIGICGLLGQEFVMESKAQMMIRTVMEESEEAGNEYIV